MRIAPTGFKGGEPSMGVLKDGSIFAAVKGDTVPTKDVLARSGDHGKTWSMVSDIKNGPVSLDPWMWVDSITNRLWNTPLYVACTWAAWSDDGGRSWDANPIAGCGVPAHDHQKITTGPPAKGVTTSGYPNVVYYSYNSFRKEGTWISESFDGGKTFNVGQVVHKEDACHAGIASPVAVAPDGTAYSAKPTCDGLDIAVSKDSGKTWKVTGHVNDAGGYQALAETVDIATDTAGNAFAVYNGKDGRLYLTSSGDGGASWSAPIVASPPSVTVTTFSNLAAGAPGHVAIGYLGTTADASGWAKKTGEAAPTGTVWHAWMGFLDDALAAQPTIVSQQVTPNDDPVQVGCIWLSGGSNACRNLGDFVDVQERDGRAYFVYTDGCAKCSTDATSRGRDVVVSLVETGPSLLGGALGALDAGAATAGGHDERDLLRPLTLAKLDAR